MQKPVSKLFGSLKSRCYTFLIKIRAWKQTVLKKFFFRLRAPRAQREVHPDSQSKSFVRQRIKANPRWFKPWVFLHSPPRFCVYSIVIFRDCYLMSDHTKQIVQSPNALNSSSDAVRPRRGSVSAAESLVLFLLALWSSCFFVGDTSSCRKINLKRCGHKLGCKKLLLATWN